MHTTHNIKSNSWLKNIAIYDGLHIDEEEDVCIPVTEYNLMK